MAKYDREFLIPYLEDVCALHLSKKRLEQMISESENEIGQIQLAALEKVKQPSLDPYVGDGDLVGMGTGCLGAVLNFLALVLLFASFFEDSPGPMLVLFLIVGAAGTVLIVRSFGAKDRANAEITATNEMKINKYAAAQDNALASVEPHVNVVQERIKQYEAEIVKIDALLERLYGVNIIPKWYRDIYPAVYLYDWFSNSRADDLDLALNTLVLEQIKDRLDTIILYQSEVIINQRIMIANQQRSMEQVERHHQELVRKLNNLQASAEEQNMYLSMIEGNTAANAYFSAANYLKR